MNLTSCKENHDNFSNSSISEGIIEFDIIYPKKVEKEWSFILPKKMTMTFKNNVYKNEISKSLIKSSIISDCNEKKMIMILNFGMDKIYTVLDEKATQIWLKNFPSPDILYSNRIDSIIDFSCAIHYGIYEKLGDGSDVTLYETKNINIKNSNWCNPFNKIQGVLLNYEISQYGLNMKLKANSFSSKTDINKTTFEIPSNFKEVSLEHYMHKMEDLFSNLL